jgi:hypothetical protein
MIPAKVILGVTGTIIGMVGLGAVVFAKLFQWADQQCAR